MNQAIDQQTLLSKRVSDQTLQEIRSLDIQEFAEIMGDQLIRNGKWYMAFRNGGERTPSVGINPALQKWTDFTRVDMYGFDVLSYYAYRTYDEAKLTGKRFVEACMEVCSLAGIPLNFTDGTVLQPSVERRVSQKNVQTEEEYDGKADDSKLNRYYTTLIDHLSLTNSHILHLQNDRGMSVQEIENRQYRSILDAHIVRYKLTKEIMRTLGEDPDGVPGFALMKGHPGSYWTLLGRAGILIPFRNIYNQIVGFQLRVDDPRIVRLMGPNLEISMHKKVIEISDKKTHEILWTGTRDDLPVEFEDGRKIAIEEGQKYVWGSVGTDKEKGILKGARIGHPRPIPYHTAVPSKLLEYWEIGESIANYADKDKNFLWWGEGPMKGDLVADLTEGIHLQVAGVKNFRLLFEPTLELEPKKVIIAFDADAQTKEDDVGATVLQCIEEARELLTPRGIKLYYAGWHISEAKGIDDLMMGKKIAPNLYPIN